jgi:sugar O-acyltransferase (sialic acid O-acetyltransferase NeuD family)
VNLPPILLVGAGGHARACIDVIERENRFSIAGLIGTPEEIGTRVLGYVVLASDDELRDHAAKIGAAIVTIGQIKTPEPRIRLFEMLKVTGCDLPVIVSPLAYVSRHSSVGAGSIVMHGAVVNAGVSIGRNCIVNSQALVEHDCQVGDHCHIATCAAVNSGVRIGAGTFIGSNSSIRQGSSIGEHCIVGMGQRVLTDCTSGSQLPPKDAA